MRNDLSPLNKVFTFISILPILVANPSLRHLYKRLYSQKDILTDFVLIFYLYWFSIAILI